ncbi:NepR family anti-sigma factor [uncultured Roseobacter sp.]
MIEENLKRVYGEGSESALPERLNNLLDRLRAQDLGQSGKRKSR